MVSIRCTIEIRTCLGGALVWVLCFVFPFRCLVCSPQNLRLKGAVIILYDKTSESLQFEIWLYLCLSML